MGDGVDGEAREGLGERRREALAMGLLVLLPAARGVDAIKHAERYPRYGFFVEAKSELATVLALATCNRATHAAGLSDAVWMAHCRSIEVQLPAAEFAEKSWAAHQATRWRENIGL